MRAFLSRHQPVLFTSLAIAALIMAVRQLGLLEGLELGAFDGLVRLQSDRGPDPRLLVVAITEEDIRNLKKPPPIDDLTLNEVLTKIERHQPRAIGLDIYRDLPIEPGNAELATDLQLNPNLVGICKIATTAPADSIAPPPTVPPNRLGFSDVVLDSDFLVRRNLLLITPDPESKCQANYSFSAQLALRYLEGQGIKGQKTPQEELQIGSIVFKPIASNFGGYHQVDNRGYQILLQYRSSKSVARQVTLTEVLQDRVDPSLVKDRIVLIGSTAASGNDFFYTPYSARGREDLRIPGIILHAQMVSQILSVVLDGQPLLWSWSGWIVALWVWGWSLLGAILVWYLRHPLLLLASTAACAIALAGICYLLFAIEGWIPLIPPLLGLIATAVSVVSYKTYKAESPQITQLPITQPVVSFSQQFIGANTLLKGRYRILERLGRGGFGVTYKAEDTQQPSHPAIVVKQLQPVRDDEEFMAVARRLFNAEAETLEMLGKNDQIPQLMAYFEEHGEFFLVQEFIKGHALSKEILLGRPLSESYVVALLKNILPVLDFIHRHRVIHRDIKPANIIRREGDGKLVLIDFGAVKKLETEISTGETNTTVGIITEGYAPPEQHLGQPVFSSDIYALGIMAIQALTGLPLPAIVKDEVRKQVVWRERAPAQVSDRLAAILDRMVRLEVSDRYQSAAEVLQALEDLG